MDRIRWDNIARAAAVLAVIALVVAWPHLRAAPPDLPPASAAPVAVADPAPATDAAPAPEAVPAPPPRRPGRHLVRRRPHPRPVSRMHAAASSPAPGPAAAPTPPQQPRPRAPDALAAPSASDQAAREFAVP